MSLNIKNERTHALVRELAALTGMSQTSAVEDAVRRRLEALRSDRQPAGRFTEAELAMRKAEIRRIVADLHAETTPEQWAAFDRAEDDLYDELGLPK
ncbi:type II toxin-antitoxin system VapB family antitoxin [Microbacterium sp. 2FI]|uniref:type II toxin-antitoxin system VapB family antitoxin n=1 Tax=Microbacterium sp. 2FI TaxID=2502193 RepID=UPI0010F71290|nr:type II toxin-antitoxin system VapB family antitoxin [Microbacterium sp. 2FI]